MKNDDIFLKDCFEISSSFHAYAYYDDAMHEMATDVATEVPIAFSFNGTTYAVMMATASDLRDFAVGFSFTEGVIQNISEIETLDIIPLTPDRISDGIDLQITLAPAQRDALQARRRHMAGPVGCGMCGIESIEAALRPVQAFSGAFQVSAQDICRAVADLSQYQRLNRATGCAHAAAFYKKGENEPEQTMILLREDVGRHNALDKVIGALLNTRSSAQEGMITTTSRLSVEMIQKAAMIKIPLIAAISAPTAKAIEIAQKANITLVSRVRDKKFQVFTCPEKII